MFNEITKKAIEQAFSHPTRLNQDQINAQQTRRFLDRVVGYMLSPLLWKKIARGLSAGRVQSVAVKLVVEREKEINAFIPEEYWEIHSDLKPSGGDQFRTQVVKQGEQNFRPTNKQDTDAALEILENSQYQVAKRETKPSTSKHFSPQGDHLPR